MVLTDVAEGTIVRVITRLDETCREVRDAARVIGDASLMKKMEEAQVRIKRDSTSRPFLFFPQPPSFFRLPSHISGMHASDLHRFCFSSDV